MDIIYRLMRIASISHNLSSAKCVFWANRFLDIRAVQFSSMFFILEEFKFFVPMNKCWSSSIRLHLSAFSCFQTIKIVIISRVCAAKLFSLLLMVEQNKLQCLALAIFISLVIVKNQFGFYFRYCISSFKLFTSSIDKYWPQSTLLSSF